MQNKYFQQSLDNNLSLTMQRTIRGIDLPIFHAARLSKISDWYLANETSVCLFRPRAEPNHVLSLLNTSPYTACIRFFSLSLSLFINLGIVSRKIDGRINCIAGFNHWPAANTYSVGKLTCRWNFRCVPVAEAEVRAVGWIFQRGRKTPEAGLITRGINIYHAEASYHAQR